MQWNLGGCRIDEESGREEQLQGQGWEGNGFLRLLDLRGEEGAE